MGRGPALLLVGLLWGCNGQPPAAVLLATQNEVQPVPSNKPLNGFEPDQSLRLSKDLGVVRTGTKQEVEFEISNPSDTDWTLHDMTKICRCVVAEPLPQIIKSKSSAKLKLTIEAGETSGNFDRQVRLNFTNCPGPVVLEVKTRVRAPLYVSSRELRFPRSAPGQTIRATARVENWSDANWESLKVTPSVDWMQAQATSSAVPKTEGPEAGLHMKQMWDITLTGNPPPEVTGTISQSIAIKANGADFSITLPAIGERPHPVVSRPPALIVSRRPTDVASSGTGQTFFAAIQIPPTSHAKTFQITSATGIQLDGFEISFEQTSQSEARVQVVIPAGQSGGISGRVVVKFADGLPVLVIPVAGGV